MRSATARRLVFGALAAVVIAVGVFGDRARAQQPAGSVRVANFDIRAEPKDAAAGYLARVAPDATFTASLASARAAGIARLQAEYAALDVENSPLLGTIEIVGTRPGSGFLTGPSADRVAALRGFLAGHADAYGVSPGQAQSLELVADYVNPAGNMAWVELEQRINGLPVFQGFVRGGFTRNGELARVTGPLASGLDGVALPASPALGAARAVFLAAAHVGWPVAESDLVPKSVDAAGHVTFDRGSMADDAKASLVYFPLAPGVARLAWSAEIWGDPDVFLVVIDALDGTVLFRKNLTNYQTQAASYTVYNDDSPAPMSPTTTLPGSGTQAPFIGRTTFSQIGNEPPNTFNSLGWMTDGTNLTDGNNVQAGIDRDGFDGVDAAVVGSPNRVFNFGYDPAVDGPLTPAYQNGEVTDTFYWTNRYHDSLYLLGFTEPARNFQNDNFLRGGSQLDRIRAEAQDSSGQNNANFSTPPDGTRGRMQMYIFPGPTPDRSSGLDHDVLLHELTHGTSNRLHANASGLNTLMAVGMGEGWSDFFARALLSTAAEDVNGVYSTGGWVTNQIVGGFVDNYYYGIRRFPYAVKTTVGANGRPHNPLTLSDIDPLQIDLSDGAFAPAFVGAANEVHNVGELWCMVLLEVRARFITRLGFATGNQRFLQFVTDGMKLDPISPTLLQGRDSILAAAAAGGGTPADTADIWAGFASRGIGFFATVDAATFAVNQSFTVPGETPPSFSIGDVSVFEGNSGTATATFTVSLANPSLAAESRVRFATADGTATTPGSTFTQAGPISIPTVGVSAPYPATLVVSGLPASTLRVKARFNSLTHTFLSDLDVLLVGPGGQKVLLMSDAGGSAAAFGINLTIDDGAPPMGSGTLVTGTYSPTDLSIGPADVFPAPAPAGPYGTALSAFNGTNPNGTWSLYVLDDEAPDGGNLAGGFSLIFTVPSDDYIPATGQLIFPVGGSSTQTVNVTINGDTAIEPHETFFVNLSAPSNAIIADAQGLGMIQNDDGLPAPTVLTEEPTNLTKTSVTLNGTANPNGFATTASFEYGTTNSFGTTTPGQAIGSGSTPVAIGGGSVTGLTCNTGYSFRAIATNANGTGVGSTWGFTTAGCITPTAHSGVATLIGRTGATLNGHVSPNGFATTANFEYGLTTSYGNTTPAQPIGSGSSLVSIGGGAITGLLCSTPYHFRVVASNVDGPAAGADTTFTTAPCTSTAFRGFVYALTDGGDYVGTNFIYAYGVGSTGTLTQIPGFPVASGIGKTEPVSERLAYDAVNRRLYAVNGGSSTLSVYSVNQATGVLTPMPYSPIALGGGQWMTVAVHPSGSPVIAGSDGGDIASFVVTSTTATAAAGSPYAGGAMPLTSVFSRDGNYFYAGAALATSAAGFSVTPSTGVLSPLPGSPFNLGAFGPVAFRTDSAGRLFTAYSASDELRVFTTAGGPPSGVAGNPFFSGLIGSAGGVIHPAGFYMVSNYNRKVSVHRIAGSGSATTLTTVPGSPFASGGFDTRSLALSRDGRLLFAANAVTHNLTAFSVDTVSGALAAVFNQPDDTLGNLGLITGLVFVGSGAPFGDLDGDGKGDLLLRNKSTGQDIGWLMNGLTVSLASFMPTIADTNWKIAGRGDFDGDGKADVILRNSASGQDIGWLMNGLTVSLASFMPTIADTNWEIKGVGDFDGDGKSDVILRNKSTGQDIGWLMNGLTVSLAAFMPTIADTNWEIAGVGDFDGDGKSDVILRNKSTGQNIGWLMNGLTVSLAAFMPTIADTNWEIRGVGDFSGDGKADVILRNKVTGQNIGWLMNGLTVASSALLPTIADTNWEIKGVGDFDGDGNADVILRNKSTGQNVGWLMNGLTVASSAPMPTIADTNWEFVGQGP